MSKHLMSKHLRKYLKNIKRDLANFEAFDYPTALEHAATGSIYPEIFIIVG